MRIILAMDIIDGKCVRLTKGDYSTKKVYNENPLEIAKEFESNGIQYLHLIDLDGAKSKQIINAKTLETIAAKTNLTIDFGGGLKSDEDVRIAFECGANQITSGSVAANSPEIFMRWLAKYGSDKIILGADCKDRKIATNGWLKTIDTDVVDFIEAFKEKGITNVICTDIAKDGTLQGTSNELYIEIIKKTNVNLIASGGVASIADLYKIKGIGCEGAIIGKAIYEGKIALQELQKLC